MKLSLFYVSDNPNVIGKELKEELVLDVLFKRDFDIINPRVVLTDPNKTGFIGLNYMWIPELKRYYFINSVENLANNLWVLSCSCDVLETYKDDIKKSMGKYKRTIKTGDYVDVNFDASAFTTITKHNSSVTPEEDEVMILSTVGVS